MDDAGLANVQNAIDLQAQELGSIGSFVDGNCSHLDAFSGFLSLFAGSYGEALATMRQSLDDSVEAATARAQAMAATRGDYSTVDSRVHGSLHTLGAQVGPATQDLGGGDTPTMPAPYGATSSGVSGVFGTGLLDGDGIPLPRDPSTGLPGIPDNGSPLSPLDVVDQGLNVVESGNDLGEAQDTRDDIGDFLEENAS
ncbi:hypothetical protein [Nocardioides aurantiacus]|uniref:hypothetical protein n=1 Tax=Nocardioides aurantiacus TaxID=86796 RepID=UPI0011CDF7C2|nr:hypothetical protein [Nocardioides aurantiacus]